MKETYSLEEIWVRIEEVMNENPEPYRDVNAVYQIEVTDRKKCIYQLRLSDGQAVVEKGDAKEADCTLSLSEGSFKKMLAGKLNGAAAYMTGKLKVKGKLGLALKLQSLLGQYDVKAYQ